MWRTQADALRRAGRTVVAVDLPGHGGRRGERFTLDGAVATVADGVRRAAGPGLGPGDGVGDAVPADGSTGTAVPGTGAGRALVVGLSLGGYVALAHAARHPEQVAGVVAASCCTRPWRPALAAWALAARGIVLLPDGGARLNEAALALAVPAAAARDAAAGGFALDVMGDVLREIGRAAPLEDLRRIDAPVWLVNGRYDHFRGEERRFLAACRRGRLVLVPGATHLVSLSAPVRFTRVLLEAADALDIETGEGTAGRPVTARAAPRHAPRR